MGSRNNKPGRIVKGTVLQPNLKGASGVWSLDEAMQAHRANAWPQPNLFQPVASNLRNSSTKTSYLTRILTRSGNQTTWTMSCWFKRSSLGSTQVLWEATDSSGTSNRATCRFSSDSFQASDSSSGLSVTTTQVFRDTSAWYHIVLASDTTQSTNTNRFKLYVNGQQITSFSSATWPTQGSPTLFNSASFFNYIGATRPAFSQYFDGYIGEVNFVDGYQLDPGLFGKFDTNNTWVPVPYTGTRGTNGFYLPFTNAVTSQTLGYDASLTGTATYDVDQDPYRGSVALHLTGNGPAGGNNNVFADSSPNNFAITRNGDTTQGSFSPFPLNSNTPYNPATHGASAYFDGSGDYLSCGSQSAYAFGTGNFTIEAWVYVTSRAAEYNIASTRTAAGTVNGWSFAVTTGGGVTFYSNSHIFNGAGTVPLNAWTHIAITRAGTGSNQVKLYINGTSAATTTSSENYSNTTLAVGNANDGGQFPFLGHISNFRIIKGVAVYTAAFTPTNKPFGTLTNNLVPFSEDFTQWSTNGVTVTSNATIAPDGTPTAAQIYALNGGGTFAFVSPSVSNPSGTITFSAYLKAKEITTGSLFLTQGGNNGAVFDLIGGTVSSVTGTGNTAAITNAGNGWWRCSVTNTGSPSATASGFRIGPSNGALTTYSFDGSIYVWGAQIEQTSSVTTYTPTPANFSTAPSLLLNFANAAVTDSAGTRNFVTTTNASITASSKYGQGALYFDGSASTFLSTPYSDGFSIGASDYTVEFWCNLSAYGEIVGAFNLTSPYPGWLVNVGNFGTAGKIGFFHANATVSQTVNSTNTVPLNTWTHIAVVKQNNFLKMFINGQLDSSHSLTLTSTGSDQQINIGSDANSLTAPGRRITGSLDDLRITKGVARYQDSFTPPARALPETGGKSFVTTNVNAGVVRSFTTTGSTSWTAPTDVTSVEVLVVAGGGAGGNNHAGGGGAGGLIYNNQYPVTPGLTYTVTVGAGGLASGTGANNNTNGGNSQFGALTAIGGGAGGNRNDTAGTSPGQNGGSGGGGGGAQGHLAGSYVAGLGTAGQGFSGGVAVDTLGGGGGGASGVGAAGVGTRVGGNGLQFGVSGTPQYYAGGGGGSNGSASAAGGLGGGGTSGAGVGSNGTAGTANTGGGGGGGGAGNTTGSNGGSGVVIVRYTTTAVGNSSDATSDNLVDSPTQYGHDYGNGGEVVGNYSTLNPLVLTGGATLSNGNLNILGSTAYRTTPATIAMTSGKWYWENKLVTFNPSTDVHVGVCLGNFTSFQDTWVLSTAFGWGYTCQGGLGYNSSTGKNISSSVRAAGDTIGLAFDADAGNLYAYVNGAVVNGGSPIYTGLTSGPYFPFVTTGDSTGSVACNFGQRAWTYAPPTGFNAITTKNLPRPAVGSAAAAPNEYFGTILYTGNNTASRSFTGLNFRPDLVIIKDRTTANNWIWNDSVRGASNTLFSNNDFVAYTDRGVATFDSAGFTMDANLNGDLSTSGNLYVAWCWRAGGASVANTAGAITSQVSANTASGFSIVTYTGTGTQASVGHGLSAAPELIITKARNQTLGWYTYTTVIDGSMDYFLLNTNAAKGDSGLTVPTSTVFYNDGWSASYNMLAYCFHSVAGYSKIGTYTSNGSADGTFVYTGFRPAFIMIKRYDSGSTADWQFIDTTRDVVNASGLLLQPNANYTESNATPVLDFLSNGFKNRNTYNVTHASGGTYIYMAFAGKPFGNVNGTAR